MQMTCTIETLTCVATIIKRMRNSPSLGYRELSTSERTIKALPNKASQPAWCESLEPRLCKKKYNNNNVFLSHIYHIPLKLAAPLCVLIEQEITDQQTEIIQTCLPSDYMKLYEVLGTTTKKDNQVSDWKEDVVKVERE